MLVKKKMSAPRRNLLVVVMIILVAVIGYLVFSSFFTGIMSPQDKEPVTVAPFDLPRINADFNDDFLLKSPYINLRQRSNLPVQVGSGETGRTNPFRVIQFINTQQ